MPQVRGNSWKLTIAEVNAGKIVIPATTGRTITPLTITAQAIGGAVGGLTTVDVQDTAASPVTIATFAQASLTQNTVLSMGDSGATPGAGYGVAATVSKGIRVIKAGSTGTTATHVVITMTWIVG